METKLNIVVTMKGDDGGLVATLENVNVKVAALGTALSQVGDAASASMKNASVSTEVLSERADAASKKITDAFNQLVASGKQVTDQLELAKTAFMAFAGVKWAASQVKGLIDMADASEKMTARLKLATKEAGNYNEVNSELQRIARATSQSFEYVASVYLRVEKTMSNMGYSTAETMDAIEALSTSLKLSGADASATDAVISNFTKSLQRGSLSMRDLTSMADQSPRTLRALADGLGVSEEKLNDMARAGQLTASKVIPALNRQLGLLRDEAEKMPKTVSDAMTNLNNAISNLAQGFNNATGATSILATVINFLADNLKIVMTLLTALATLIMATLVRIALPSLIAAFNALVKTAVSGAGLVKTAWDAVAVTLARARAAAIAATTSFGLIGKAAMVLVAVVGVLAAAIGVVASAIVGWKFGTILREQFAIVRAFGVWMIEAIMTGIEMLRYAWESFLALFTSDTLSEALARHRQRLAEMGVIFKDMYADAWSDAEKNAKKVEDAINKMKTALGDAVAPLKVALEGVNKELGEVEKKAQEANTAISNAMSSIATAYQGVSGLAEQQAKDELAAITERYNAELDELNRVQTHKGLLIEKATQLFTDLVATETALTKNSTEERIKLIEEEGRIRLEVAKRQGETDAERKANVIRVENEILTEKKSALQTALDTYRKHINDLNAEANRHLDEIKRIEREKQMLFASAEEMIREIARSGMSDFEAYQDKQTEIAELQAKMRIAAANGESENAKSYYNRITSLARSSAGAVKEADREVVTGKEAIATATQNIRTATETLAAAYDAEARAHKTAADNATESRKKIEKTFADTQEEVNNLSTELAKGFKATMEIDTSAIAEALVTLDEAIAKKEVLLPIKADLEQALKEIEAMKDALEKKGVAVNVDTEKARDALKGLKTYAEENGNIELRVATENADDAIKNVATNIENLSKIETESKHSIKTNADEAKKEVMSLDGTVTHSTHIITVQRVEANAAGGLVGASIPRFAAGGFVGFPGMRGGAVPGSGNGDTVPRTLDAGAFVMRKAAVQKYGISLLAKLAEARFALGGVVAAYGGSGVGRGSTSSGGFSLGNNKEDAPIDAGASKADEEVFEKLGKIRDAALILPRQKGFTSISDWAYYMKSVFWSRSRSERDLLATLVNGSFHKWMYRIKEASQARPPYGISAGIDLLEYAYAGGGSVSSGTDTVPAMLTPGEYVINRDAVKKIGVGFLEMLNAAKVPAQEFFQHFSLGGLVDGGARLAQMVMPPTYSTPAFAGMPETASAAPLRTVRLELAVGGQKISANISESDESKLLSAIASDRARAR